MTPQQVIEGERARQDALRHFGNNRVLTMDELARLKDVRPHFEREYKLPGDSRQGNKVWMFSIDGYLDGTPVKRCLFAGECIIVQERSFERAHKLAKDGVIATVEIAVEIFEEQQRLVVTASPMERTMVEAGGRRSAAGSHAPDLATDEKLRRMIVDAMGTKNWKP